MALPQLVARAFTADAALVDGSHRFHEVFFDLYLLRKIVRPGGLIVPDDHWWPSVSTAARYFETNMGWQVVHGAFDGGTIDQATGRRVCGLCGCPTLRASRRSSTSSRSSAHSRSG